MSMNKFVSEKQGFECRMYIKQYILRLFAIFTLTLIDKSSITRYGQGNYVCFSYNFLIKNKFSLLLQPVAFEGTRELSEE